MNTLGVWSMLAILYQTILCIFVSWLTLSCRLSPDSSELAEVTLMKLLYLYDPEACGRIHFYNYTTKYTIEGGGAAVVWPVKNEVAARFRGKMQIWLALHVIWAAMGIVNITQGSRPCSYYVTLLPFTLTGVAILVVDLVFCTLFLIDATHTESEPAILEYINSDTNNLHSINITLSRPVGAEDTSWIAVIFAYCSLRGVVPWLVNFWLIKDSYFNGLVVYHHLRKMTAKGRSRAKSVQIAHISV